MRPSRTTLALSFALALASCADDPGNKKPDAGPTIPAAVLDAKAGPIGDIDAPPAVVAWGGAANVEKLAGTAQAFLQQITPLAPPVLDLAKDELRRKLALTKLDGVDWKRPARAAIFDPKGMPKATVAVILSLSNKDQFLASLPIIKKLSDEGNAMTYRDDLGRTICLNFVDDMVVVTWEKKQFPSSIGFFATLARSTIESEQAFFLSAKNVSVLYAKEIDEMIVQAKQQMVGSAMAVPGVQSEVSSRVLSWMVASFKDLERIEAIPGLPEDGVLLSLRLHPRADSELQKSFKAIEARPHTLIAKLPADAPMFASFSTNPDSVDGLTTRLVEWAMSVGFGGKVPEGYAQAMKEYFQATGGEMAIAVHKPFSTPGAAPSPVSGDGLALTTLLTVRDEARLRASMRKSKETLKDKQIVETYKKAGVTVVYKEGAYKVGTIPVDTAEVKFDKDKNPLAQLGPFGEAMGEFSTNHMAVSKDLAVIGYGKDARKAVEGFLNGKVTGGMDKAAGPSRAFRLGVKDPVGILYISPVEMAKRASLGGKNPLAESLKDLAGTSGVALSFSAREGVFEIVVDVPTEQARNIAQGAARAKAILPQ